ncbi:hypothetical protein DFP73DRAFT_543996 [Morchella snyderi]|nr:hypothetical protein DFP73DRAFT_543996 [Morchella snyderi]
MHINDLRHVHPAGSESGLRILIRNSILSLVGVVRSILAYLLGLNNLVFVCSLVLYQAVICPAFSELRNLLLSTCRTMQSYMHDALLRVEHESATNGKRAPGPEPKLSGVGTNNAVPYVEHIFTGREKRGVELKPFERYRSVVCLLGHT